MRITHLASATCVLAAATLPAQLPVDLNLWTEEHINGTGPWTVDAPRLFCNSTNTVNTDCSTFYSDFQVNFLEFRMSIDPAGGDDDIAGFILGWEPGDGSNPATADYVLVDWKRATQAYQNWGTSIEGLALSHMQGQFTPGIGGAPIDLWSHTGACVELARGNRYGSTGWEFSRNYFFRVVYTSASVDIWVDDQLEFSVTGTFHLGRFACYNLSQSRTEFQFPLPGSFTPVGTGCPGTAGTPYLFGPSAPYVGEDLPIIVANLPANAVALLMLGLSNSTWGSVALPAALAPLGAPGCTAYNSPDAFLPMTNFNGTAYLNIHLPSTVLPTTTPLFHAQGLVADFGANALGLTFFNGAEATLGIR